MKVVIAMVVLALAIAYEPGIFYVCMLLAMLAAGVYGVLCASWGE